MDRNYLNGWVHTLNRWDGMENLSNENNVSDNLITSFAGKYNIILD